MWKIVKEIKLPELVMAVAAASIAYSGYRFTIRSNAQARLAQIRSTYSLQPSGAELGSISAALATTFFQGNYKQKLTALEVLKLKSPALTMQLASTVADDDAASRQDKQTAERIRQAANILDLNTEFLNRLELSRELLSAGFKAESCEEFGNLFSRVPILYTEAKIVDSSTLPEYWKNCNPPNYVGAKQFLEAFKRIPGRSH